MKYVIILSGIENRNEDRMMSSIQTVREMNLTLREIENLLDKLQDYHGVYSPLFTRHSGLENTCITQRYATVKALTMGYEPH